MEQRINFTMPKFDYATLLLQTTKRARKMAEIAGIKVFLQLFTLVYYGYVLFVNLDNVKGWILVGIAAVSGLGFGIAKLYFYIKKENRASRREEYELAELERAKRLRDKQEIIN